MMTRTGIPRIKLLGKHGDTPGWGGHVLILPGLGGANKPCRIWNLAKNRLFLHA
jgi:hypothetical protein